MNNLEEIIADSINDAQNGEVAPEGDTSTSAPVEAEAAPTDTAEAPVEASETKEGVTDQEVKEVLSEAHQKPAEAPEDDFSKEFGIPATMVGGRVNRIPYPRVVAIANSKAEKVAKPLRAKITELEGRAKEYDTLKTELTQFGEMMKNDPKRFLGEVLSQIPAYKPLFDTLQKYQELQNQQVKEVAAAAGAPATQPAEAVAPGDEMPAPNKLLPDGTSVYDLDGLKQLLQWNSNQVRNQVTQELTQRYAPIEEEHKARLHIQNLIPQFEREIATARTWEGFVENEAEIIQVLKQYPQADLTSAYQYVMNQKLRQKVQELTPEREKMRKELIEELKKTPVSGSAVPAAASRPAPTTAAGSGDLFAVIKESIAHLPRK